MNQRWSHHGRGPALTLILAVAVLGGLGWLYQRSVTQDQRGRIQPAVSQRSGNIRWDFWPGSGWRASGTPPACPPQPMLQTPVDLARVTSVLYPGQTRGQYKAHGGFRFDGSKNDAITVRAPMDAEIIRASRYIESGEVQYLFDFTAPCGIRYRFDHLLVLSPALARIAEQLPPAREGDSRTTVVRPPAWVAAGEILATAVGIRRGPNVGVDFGVYDLRQKNAASGNPAWARLYSPELEHHGVCWFEWLSPRDAARVRALLPGSSESGAKSDYCR